MVQIIIESVVQQLGQIFIFELALMRAAIGQELNQIYSSLISETHVRFTKY
jgi:hypothetical protein